MRKLMVLVMVLSLVSMGCCSLTAPDGTVTKSPLNCLKTAQDKVCNAPANVIAVIDAVITVAEMAVAAFVPGTAAYIAAVQSFGTAVSIKDGLCVSLTQLNQLIDFLQNPQVQAMQAKKGIMKAQAVPVDPFIQWRNTAK